MRYGLVIVAATAMLVGCAGGDDGSAASSPAPTIGASVPPDVADRIFLEYVRSDIPALADQSDEGVKAFGTGICGALQPDNQESWLAVVKAATQELGLSGEDAGKLIGASTGAYCPEKASASPNG